MAQGHAADLHVDRCRRHCLHHTQPLRHRRHGDHGRHRYR